MKKITACLLALTATPALAQTPDTLCDGLASVLKAADEMPAFSSLNTGWRQGSAPVARPAGMEGAHSCDVSKGEPGKADKFVCSWMLGETSVPAMTLPQRVKACAAVKGWTDTPFAEKPKHFTAIRLVQPVGKLEVVAIHTDGRGSVATLTVLGPKP